MGLVGLAGLDLKELVQPERTQTLFATLEAAANQLTQVVLPYWSQNRHLRMRFDIRQSQPGDPAGMTSGMNIWGLIDNTKHTVSTARLVRDPAASCGFSLLSPGIRSFLRRTTSSSYSWTNRVFPFMEEPRPTFFAISRSNLSPITNLSTQPTHLSWSTPCILNASALSRT